MKHCFFHKGMVVEYLHRAHDAFKYLLVLDMYKNLDKRHNDWYVCFLSDKGDLIEVYVESRTTRQWKEVYGVIYDPETT